MSDDHYSPVPHKDVRRLECLPAGEIGNLRAEIERLRAATDTARQAIQYSIDMGGTDPAGVLLQALNKCDAALGGHQQQAVEK